MTTQSVKAQTVNLFPDTKAGNSSSVNKSSGKNFSSIMDGNLKSKSENSIANDNVSSSKPEPKLKDNDKTTAIGQRSSDANAKAVNNTAKEATKEVNKEASDSLQIDELEENNTDLAGYMEMLQNILDMLRNTVQSNLGITEDELNKTMEELGFTVMDLFNPDNLKQLVLQINGTDDISEVLTDENLADTINRLIQAVDDLKSNPDLTISQEELTDIINRFQKNQLTEPQAQEVSLKTVPETKEQEVSNITDNRQNEITFEVHKFTGNEPDTGSNKKFNSDSGHKEAEVETQSPVDTFIQNLAVKGNDRGLSFAEQIANV